MRPRKIAFTLKLIRFRCNLLSYVDAYSSSLNFFKVLFFLSQSTDSGGANQQQKITYGY